MKKTKITTVYSLWVSILYALVVGTVCCVSVVNGDTTVESGQTQAQAQTILVQTVHVTTGSFVDTAACYSAMEESMAKNDNKELDGDNDRKMNLGDYLNFAIAYMPDYFLVDAAVAADNHENQAISSTMEELHSTFYRLAYSCTLRRILLLLLPKK